MKRLAAGSAALSLVLTAPAWAEPLPSARPEQVGLSSGRLERVGQRLRAEVEKGQIPGAVVLVARKGRVAYFESFGWRDPASRAPMPKDAIFRLYSMTKPITSVAAMILVEEGRIVLTDPVSKFLPPLEKLEVSVARFHAATGEVAYSTVPADREITVQDLLRHTSGFTYGSDTSNAAVKDAYAKNGVDWKGLTPSRACPRTRSAGRWTPTSISCGRATRTPCSR